jgi:hypothetical protein
VARLLGVPIPAISDSGDTTIISFVTDITSGQKSQLDTFMASSNLDVIPDNTGKTTYLIAPMDTIVATTGLDADIYPTPNGLVVQFTKSLTNQEKTALKNAFGATLQLL